MPEHADDDRFNKGTGAPRFILLLLLSLWCTRSMYSAYNIFNIPLQQGHRCAPGRGDTVILTESGSNGSKITVYIPKEDSQ
jgi:hypothetical protein